MNYPTFYLDAGTRSQLARINKIISKKSLDPILWVKLPDVIFQDFHIESISDVTNEETYVDSEYYQRDDWRPWIHISLEGLDTEVGYHIYKIVLASLDNLVRANLFFSYRIQDDDADTPYIYMNREESE